jgi:hypothetical protein
VLDLLLVVCRHIPLGAIAAVAIVNLLFDSGNRLLVEGTVFEYCRRRVS